MSQSWIQCHISDVQNTLDRIAALNQRVISTVMYNSYTLGMVIEGPDEPPSEPTITGHGERADHLHKKPRYMLEIFSGPRSIYRTYFYADGFDAVHKEWPRYTSASQVVLRPVAEHETELPLENGWAGDQKAANPYRDLAVRLLDSTDMVETLADRLRDEGL